KAKDVPPEHLPDLIVWPETTFSEDWFDLTPGVDPATVPVTWQNMMALQRLAATHNGETLEKAPPDWKKALLSHELWKIMADPRANHLLGLNGMEIDADGKRWKYNSAKFIGHNGRAGLRYDKMHLVPFGEYVPLRNTFPWLQSLTPYSGDY